MAKKERFSAWNRAIDLEANANRPADKKDGVNEKVFLSLRARRSRAKGGVDLCGIKDRFFG